MSMSSSPSDTDMSVSVVAIPDQYLDRVMEYVSSLERDEAEVAGFADSLSGGSVSGGGKISGTGCKTSGGTFNPTDFTCTDSDNITTK